MACCSCQTSPVPPSCRVAITSADLAELLYIQGLDSNLCTKFELLTDAVHLVDCAGNPISINTPIVTCADFANELCLALAALDSAGDVELGVTELVGADCQTYTVPETPLTVVDSDCINLTASGAFGHTLTADVIVSPDEGNTLVCNPNGLFVPTAADTTVVLGGDTDCISVTVVEGPADTFTVTADPIISPNANNAITCIGNGLFANTPTPVTVLDTPSVNLTLTGGNVLSADVIISPNGGNQVSILPNGLFVPDTIINAVDTACLNLDVTEGPANTFSITGSIILDGDPDNLLSCNGDGLMASPPSCDQIVATFDAAAAPPPPLTRFLAEDCNMYTIPQAQAPDCEEIVAAFTPSAIPLEANGLILGADCFIYEAPGVDVSSSDCIALSVSKPGHDFVVSADVTLDTTYPGYPADCNGLQCNNNGLSAPPDAAGTSDTLLSSVNIHPSGPSISGEIYTSEVLHLDIVNDSDCRSAVLTTVYRHPAARLDENVTGGGCRPYRCNIISYRNTNLPGVEVITAPITESHIFSDSTNEGIGIQHSETVLVYVVPPSFAGSIELSVVADASVGCAQSLFISNIRLSYTLVTVGA